MTCPRRDELPVLVPPQPAAGFTLLEVLVALALLCTGALGTATLLVHLLATSNSTQRQAAATALLADAAELAAVDLLDPLAVSRWQATAAAALPTPSDPLSAATVLADPLDASGRTRRVALRWAEPGHGADRLAELTVLQVGWRP